MFPINLPPGVITTRENAGRRPRPSFQPPPSDQPVKQQDGFVSSGSTLWKQPSPSTGEQQPTAPASTEQSAAKADNREADKAWGSWGSARIESSNAGSNPTCLVMFDTPESLVNPLNLCNPFNPSNPFS